MKKILLSLFAISGLFFITGCSLAGTTVDDNSKLSEQVSLLQQQMSGLNLEVQELKEQNDELIKENETIKISLSDQNSGASILLTQNKELKKDIEKYKQTLVQERLKNKKTGSISTEVSNINKNTNIFTNPTGKYSFNYSSNWNAEINNYVSKNSLFGPNATSQSSIGGVEVIDYTNSLEEYINYMENNAEIIYISQENITVNGFTAIRTEYSGFPVNGFSVLVKKDNNVYNIYINSTNISYVELFDNIVSSFEFVD